MSATERDVAPSPFSPEAAVPAASGRSDHYLGLDFLRGVAALAVVWFHCSSRFELPLLFAHGYFAVDFFFVLSGFVIARAYGERLITGRLTLRKFALIRIIRLMPLVVVGTLLAALIEIGRPVVADHRAHLNDTAQAILFGAFLVPTLGPTTLEHTIFPLNGPFWSLSLEAVANTAFAICARVRLTLIIVVAMLAFCAPFLAWEAWASGSIHFGFGPDDYWFGYARVGWSFSAGGLLYRFRHHAPRMPLFVSTIALVALMLVPPIQSNIGRSFDLLTVLFVLPAIVWVASATRLERRGQRWSAWSGDLSYPVYALHYPVVKSVGTVVLKMGLTTGLRLSAVAISSVIVVAGAGFIYIVFDVPVRRWLTSKFLRREPVAA